MTSHRGVRVGSPTSDDCCCKRRPLSARRAAPQRVGMNGEGRLLAHWDEFVEHRRESRARFDDQQALLEERREGEQRLGRLLRTLEARVERLMVQETELAGRSSSWEDRARAQERSMDGCRESIEALRDKVQSTVQDLVGALSSVRLELAEDTEQRQCAIFEALRHGDRGTAEEARRQLDGVGDQLTAGLHTLRCDLQAQLAELRRQLETARKASDVEAAQAQVVATRDDFCRAAAARFDEDDVARREQCQRLSQLDSEVAKLRNLAARADARAAAAEQQAGAGAEQIREDLGRADAHAHAGFSRVRNDLDTGLREAIRTLKQELHDELRTTRETLPAELQAVRREFHADVRGNAIQLKDELLVSCREAMGKADEAQRVAAETREKTEAEVAVLRREAAGVTEATERRLAEASSGLRGGLQDAGQEFRAQLDASLHETRESLQALQTEASGAWRRLAELGNSTGRAQAVAEEALAESQRTRVHADAGLGELREALVAEVAHAVSLAQQVQEACQSVDVPWASDLLQRIKEIETVVAEQASLWQSQLQDLTKLECQHEAAASTLQREVTRVADEARELMNTTEQACRRLVSEEVRAQEAVLSESFLAHRRAAAAASMVPTSGHTERAAEQAPGMLNNRLQPSAGRPFEPFQSTSGKELGQRLDCLQKDLTAGQEILTQQEDSLVEPVGWRAGTMMEPVAAAVEPVATSLPRALAQPAASWAPRRGSGRPQPTGAASLPPPPLLGASAQAKESPRGIDQGRWCVEGSSPPPRSRPLLGSSFANAPFAATPKPRSSSISACGHGHGGVAGELHLVHSPCNMPWRRSFADCEIATA